LTAQEKFQTAEHHINQLKDKAIFGNTRNEKYRAVDELVSKYGINAIMALKEIIEVSGASNDLFCMHCINLANKVIRNANKAAEKDASVDHSQINRSTFY
jgi:bacterioferritin-associated ferredoxin